MYVALIRNDLALASTMASSNTSLPKLQSDAKMISNCKFSTTVAFNDNNNVVSLT